MRQVLAGHGFAVTPPVGWEGRIYRRPAPTAAATPQHTFTSAGAGGWLGEQTLPVVHLANFALPAVRGDFGSGAVEVMLPGSCFLALLQFGAECLGSALYRTQGRPLVKASDCAPNALQRILPGLAGAQYFFTEDGRPLCLYVVLGARALAGGLIAQVNAALAAVELTR